MHIGDKNSLKIYNFFSLNNILKFLNNNYDYLWTNDQDLEKDTFTKFARVSRFWSEWCTCKQLEPVLEEIASENLESLKVYKINIDENPMTPQKFGVRGIPTLMFFKEGKLVDSKVGSLPKSALENWIKSNL